MEPGTGNISRTALLEREDDERGGKEEKVK